MYAAFWKRFIDFSLSLIALIILLPVLLILIVTGSAVLGGNPFFTQLRPGKDEKIFRLIKFRSMTNKKDENGKLLPDEVRLVPYGKFLRATSLDELPSLINIIKGDLSIVGPRPQLVRDMVFMTSEQRRRHSVRQGLTGLAQCSGRNNMTWEQKFEYDLQYIENITFFGDVKIILKTVLKVFQRDGINQEGMATAEDLGDYLLDKGTVSREEYDKRQIQAKELMRI